MDEASRRSSLSDIDLAESSSAHTAVPRNDDPFVVALRSDMRLNIDEIVHLKQQSSSPVVASSSGTKPTTVFTSPDHESAGTKPTSNGTSYNVEDYFGKGKAIATYESSCSATQGSGSDTEREVLRETSLFEIGGQFDEQQKLRTPLKARCKRSQNRARPKLSKKPPVELPPVIHQPIPPHRPQPLPRQDVHFDHGVDDIGAASSSDEGEEVSPAAKRVSGRDRREQKYFRQRSSRHRSKIEVVSTQPSEVELEEGLAEEVLVSTASTPHPKTKPIKGTRFWVLVLAITAVILVLLCSIIGAHFTGKHRMRYTKGLIYMATILTSTFTIIAMIAARRAVHEALLAGLLELVSGFMLLAQLHEFMEPFVVAAAVS